MDVFCVGHASYDLVFSVTQHPQPDEKLVADGYLGCGGGPAANAAVMVARLGFNAGFCGYLGMDIYGENHLQELRHYQVNTDFIVRGESPTPLSAVIVKPDGKRALINYKGYTQALLSNAVDFSTLSTKTMLFDGHEPHLSVPLAMQARKRGIATVLDAGSLHTGTAALIKEVDYVVASEKFAVQFAGSETVALKQLAEVAPVVVITLGERGLIWQRGAEQGTFAAFNIQAIDTTGAGDAFHGAFAAALVAEYAWLDVLGYASAAGALCCTKVGARSGLPNAIEHQALFEQRTAQWL